VTDPCREVEDSATSRATDVGGAEDPIATADPGGVGAGSEAESAPGSGCEATPSEEGTPPSDAGVEDPGAPAVCDAG
jgi:hypothetical protein